MSSHGIRSLQQTKNRRNCTKCSHNKITTHLTALYYSVLLGILNIGIYQIQYSEHNELKWSLKCLLGMCVFCVINIPLYILHLLFLSVLLLERLNSRLSQIGSLIWKDQIFCTVRVNNSMANFCNSLKIEIWASYLGYRYQTFFSKYSYNIAN